MSKSFVQRIIYLLILILLVIFSLELLLRFTDPAGIWHFRSLSLFYSQFIINSQAEGYDFADGTYTGVGHTITIEDGNRSLPDHGDACTIAFLGDSFAFGWGVDDEYIYPYILAQQFDRVTFINTGRPAYSMANVMIVVDEVQADGYVWFIAEDDNAPIGTAYPNPPQVLWRYTALRTYYNASQQSNPDTINVNPPSYEEFSEHVIQLTGRNDLIAFGYGTLAELAGATILSDSEYMYQYHPDAEGHAQIADLMFPEVRDLISQVCGEIYAETE